MLPTDCDMSNGNPVFMLGNELCCQLSCQTWYLRCLRELYGLRELGHTEAPVYLTDDVKTALLAHAADGRPTKTEMEARIKRDRAGVD